MYGILWYNRFLLLLKAFPNVKHPKDGLNSSGGVISRAKNYFQNRIKVTMLIN